MLRFALNITYGYFGISQKSGYTYFHARGFHHNPHSYLPHFMLTLPPRKHADTLVRYFARHRPSFDRRATETSAGYFPKLVKEKIKDRSISIRLAPSILIPIPLPHPATTRASLFLVRISANNVYARVLWYAGL